jgi:hypothetical protein
LCNYLQATTFRWITMENPIVTILSNQTFITIIAAILSGILPVLYEIYKKYRESRKKDKLQIDYSVATSPYQDRLSKLLDNLKKSSVDFDEILHEMSSLATSREEEVRRLEIDLVKLENKEREVKEKVENLHNIPLPVADHLAKLIERKKSARRDYILFLSGVIVSTVISIILELSFKP